MPKRYRRPPMIDGRIQLYYGTVPHDRLSLDTCVQWGAGASKRDANYLMNVFAFNKNEDGKSVLQEMEARGYDLTTLKFSIDKKKETT